MTVDTLVNDILKGQFQEEGRGHLVHPAVKIIFVIVPLSLGTIVLAMRFYDRHLPLNLLFGVILTVFTCQSLDFRPSGRATTYRWMFFFFIGWGLIYASKLFAFSIESIVKFFGIQKTIETVGRFVSIEDALIFLLFIAAARGIIRLGVTDVLWSSRFLLFRRFKLVYMAVIFTYLIVHRTVSRITGLAWSTARNKTRLARKSLGRVKAFETGSRLFLQKLLLGYNELAQQARSLLHERGFFEKDSHNSIPRSLSAEDICALMLLVLLIGSSLFLNRI